MKIVMIILILVLSTNMSAKNLKATPKGIDLKNHYGTPTLGNNFGPKTDNISAYI